MAKRCSDIILWLAFSIGLVLSMVSMMSFCKEACKEAHDYVFFGIPLSSLGVVFFTGVLFLHYLKMDGWVGMLVGGAIGAEVVFLLIQYEVIGEWCPVCVSIALCVFMAGVVLAWDYLRNLWYSLKLGVNQMLGRQIFKGASTLGCVLLGFFVALFGVIKPETSFADGTSENENPIFGNKNSPIEIYIVSDWFCSACKDLEPQIELWLPKVLEKAAVIFVDRNIHPESMNYMPYNLSFMLKEKENYLKIRRVLMQLTAKTKTPTPEEVQLAVGTLGVRYKPLNFSDIDSGHRFFQGIAKAFQIDSTPTVVIANKKAVKAKKLVGLEEINEKNILNWIDQLSSSRDL